jgi:hypothetical protein
MSEQLYEQLDAELRERAVLVEQELEGLGSVPLYFVAIDELPLDLPATGNPRLSARIRETIGFGIRAFPRVIGLRERG